MTASGAGRLVLGTAALGLPYGLPRIGEQELELVEEATATALVQEALAAGVAGFDTAPAYGEAEVRLGRALAGAGVVWTKVDHRLKPGPDLANGLDRSLATSLERLQRPAVDLLQWHNWTAALGDDAGFRAAWDALRGDPRVRGRGCSTYGVDDALAAVTSGLFEVVQVEGNLLNPTVLDAVAAPARSRGVAIAVRSVFLQGVLTPRGAGLPPHLQPLGPARAEAEDRAADLGMPLHHLALRFVLDHPATHVALIGLDDRQQLTEALAAAARPAILVESCADLAVDPARTDPRTWGR